jgi:hypothetical protein
MEMDTLLKCTLLLVLLFAGCSKEDDRFAVVRAFEGYKSAILNDDGEMAYSLVDENTKRWYDESLSNAISLTRDEIMALGTLDKMQVILVRHRIPARELLQMTGEDLFKYAVNNGWVGKNSVSGLQIGQIQITDNFATAAAKSNGEITPLSFHFYRQENRWRIDITEINKWGEAAFSSQIEESGESEIDYIFRLIQIVSGKPVQGNIWNPLRK